MGFNRHRKSCPEKYNYLCISKESSQENWANVFSDVGVDYDDGETKRKLQSKTSNFVFNLKTFHKPCLY